MDKATYKLVTLMMKAAYGVNDRNNATDSLNHLERAFTETIALIRSNPSIMDGLNNNIYFSAKL